MDASVVIKWMVGEQGSDQAAAVMLGPVAAPDLLVSECINALWKKVTRGELSAGEAEAAALVLQSAAITFEPVQALAAQILELSMRLSHPANDCAYLALARRLQLPLVTADEKLARTGTRAIPRITAMSAYSMAVAPSSSRRNWRRFNMFGL